MTAREVELKRAQKQYQWVTATPEEREKIAAAAYVQQLWPGKNIG
jgi:hypothetical protein